MFATGGFRELGDFRGFLGFWDAGIYGFCLGIWGFRGFCVPLGVWGIAGIWGSSELHGILGIWGFGFWMVLVTWGFKFRVQPQTLNQRMWGILRTPKQSPLWDAETCKSHNMATPKP